MPTFKHPCPYCSQYIDGAAVACPFCGVTDPFTHARCPNCRAALQPGWVSCPSCGRSLTTAQAINAATPNPPPAASAQLPPAAAASLAPASAPPAAPVAITPAPAPVQRPQTPSAGATCTGCGAPLPAGARFCQQCGTLVA